MPCAGAAPNHENAREAKRIIKFSCFVTFVTFAGVRTPHLQAVPDGCEQKGTKTMFGTTDNFYTANRPGTVCVSAASFTVWAAILTALALL